MFGYECLYYRVENLPSDGSFDELGMLSFVDGDKGDSCQSREALILQTNTFSPDGIHPELRTDAN